MKSTTILGAACALFSLTFTNTSSAISAFVDLTVGNALIGNVTAVVNLQVPISLGNTTIGATANAIVAPVLPVLTTTVGLLAGISLKAGQIAPASTTGGSLNLAAPVTGSVNGARGFGEAIASRF